MTKKSNKTKAQLRMAIKRLRHLIRDKAPGETILSQAHRILSLIRDMGVSVSWFGGGRKKRVAKETDHVEIITGLAYELYPRGHANDFVAAVADAVGSKAFKEWIKES